MRRAWNTFARTLCSANFGSIGAMAELSSPVLLMACFSLALTISEAIFPAPSTSP